MTEFAVRPSSEGHRQRLRERFDKGAAQGFLPYEILELLLTYAIPRRDVKPLAKDLLRHFGSLGAVLDAAPHELLRFPGLGPTSSTLLRLVKETNVCYLAEGLQRRDVLASPDAVADFATARIAGLPHEAFLVIFLNIQNEVLDHQIVNEGTVDQVAVYPRRIIEAALGRHAAALLVAHNHPSGHTHPSEEDRRLTRTLAEACRPLDLRLLDHLIVGRGNRFSFLENGFL